LLIGGLVYQLGRHRARLRGRLPRFRAPTREDALADVGERTLPPGVEHESGQARVEHGDLLRRALTGQLRQRGELDRKPERALEAQRPARQLELSLARLALERGERGRALGLAERIIAVRRRPERQAQPRLDAGIAM
jgi:hypothetical protein